MPLAAEARGHGSKSRKMVAIPRNKLRSFPWAAFPRTACSGTHDPIPLVLDYNSRDAAAKRPNVDRFGHGSASLHGVAVEDYCGKMEPARPRAGSIPVSDAVCTPQKPFVVTHRLWWNIQNRIILRSGAARAAGLIRQKLNSPAPFKGADRKAKVTIVAPAIDRGCGRFSLFAKAFPRAAL